MVHESATLLVVEDEVLIRLDLVDLLEFRGFIVLQATNADHAISILVRRPEIRGVLSDIDLPGSMNGIELVKVISRRWPPCRLILVSGMKAPRGRGTSRTHLFHSETCEWRGLGPNAERARTSDLTCVLALRGAQERFPTYSSSRSRAIRRRIVTPTGFQSQDISPPSWPLTVARPRSVPKPSPPSCRTGGPPRSFQMRTI